MCQSVGPPIRRPRAINRFSCLLSSALMLAATLTAPSTAHGQITSVDTVFIIVMSTQPWSAIEGSSSAPYINGTLLPMASHATNYFAPAGNHTAEQNYFWLEAGSNFGISLDRGPVIDHQATTSHFVSLLTRAGLSWKTYQEGIGGTTCPLTNQGNYNVVYNPFVFFDDVALGPAQACLIHVRPYNELSIDLNRNNVARYNFIKPDICDSMHPLCSLVPDHIKQGDTWLSQEVPRILESAAYKNGGALFITWDQTGDESNRPIGMIVVSPFAKNGYTNAVRYTHGSTLRTLQQIFGVTDALGDAAAQTPLDDFFLTPKLDNASLILTWTPSSGAASYRVRRATTSGGPFTTIATGISVPNYTDRGLTNGTTYFYTVSAVNGSGESPASLEVSATPIFVPSPPTNLTVKQTP